MLRFECRLCGKCCFDYANSVRVTERDVERWKRENRKDILRHVTRPQYERPYATISLTKDFWIKPKEQGGKLRCPFIRKRGEKFVCGIHDSRPGVCRQYPFDGSGGVDPSRKGECMGIKEI